jgi:hypothetical protein
MLDFLPEDVLKQADRIVAEDYNNKESDKKFVSVKNQVKPFLTPRQEIGLD